MLLTKKQRDKIKVAGGRFISTYGDLILGKEVEQQDFINVLNTLDITKHEVRAIMHECFGEGRQ